MKTRDAVWSFSDSLENSRKFRSVKSREYKFLQEFYVDTFIPYLRQIINAHPEYSYEDLERHIKVDITKLSEAIFEGSDVYRIYLETIACNYLSKKPDKLQSIINEMVKPECVQTYETGLYKYLLDHKDDPNVDLENIYIDYVTSILKPEYNSPQKIELSEHGGTFKGTCMQYILDSLPWYLEEKIEAENKIATADPNYLSIVSDEKAKGTSNKAIFTKIQKMYLRDFNPTFIQRKHFESYLNTIVYGFSTYFERDLDEKSADESLAKILRSNLKKSIIEINSQFDKFGFTKRAQDIRKAKFTELGIGELADKLTDASYTNPEDLGVAIDNLDLADLMAYNTFLTNRYSKEATSLAEAFFITYQYDMLRKFQDPEVERFFRLKDAMDTHTETDPGLVYVIDKNSEYPTKEDLFRALKIIYPLKPSYVAIRKRITSLPEARKDASKVSIPGLIYEIKKAYPTREEFEQAMDRMQNFYPTQNELNIALDKMAFLFNPTKYFVNDVQSQIDQDPDSFESQINLTEEEELELFGNVSENPNIIRYSQRPYLAYMIDNYGSQYSDHFTGRFYSIPEYQGANLKEPPTSDISRDASKYLRFYTPIFYSYKFKDDFINSLVALTLDENSSFKNAGIILDSENDDSTRGRISFLTGIGIDAGLTSPVQVHCIEPAIKDFLREFTGDTIIPIYEGMDDFRGISNQSVFPFSPAVERYLKALAKNPDLDEKAAKYVKRINALCARKVPESMLNYSVSPTGKIKKGPFRRRYIDIKTGEIFTKEKDSYVPIEPTVHTINEVLPATDTKRSGDGGYEH